MPWVSDEMCVGCGVCVEECPVGAISISGGVASVSDEECIRCGLCHDVCPEEAVRHDGERIPEEVEANLRWARELLQHYETREDQKALIERLKRHFGKEKKVAERTIGRLEEVAG